MNLFMKARRVKSNYINTGSKAGEKIPVYVSGHTSLPTFAP
jgi:hypothetical protein